MSIRTSLRKLLEKRGKNSDFLESERCDHDQKLAKKSFTFSAELLTKIFFTAFLVSIMLPSILGSNLNSNQVSFLKFAASHDSQRYDLKEKIPLFIDKVIPEDNPSESYRYLSLPFCVPEEVRYKSQSLSEVMQGSRKIYSGYDIRFGVDASNVELCKKELSPIEVANFIYAINKRYHFVMYFDEIPIRGYIGEIIEGQLFENGNKSIDRGGVLKGLPENDEGRVRAYSLLRSHRLLSEAVYLYTRLNFRFAFNRDRVIEAHLTPDEESKVRLELPAELIIDRRKLKEVAQSVKEDGGRGELKDNGYHRPILVPKVITFSYSVNWVETDVNFEDRSANRPMEIHREDFEIQWFSIINSICLAFLVALILISMLLRVLRKDFQSYSGIIGEEIFPSLINTSGDNNTSGVRKGNNSEGGDEKDGVEGKENVGGGEFKGDVCSVNVTNVNKVNNSTGSIVNNNCDRRHGEFGWKNIKDDVFRFPVQKSLLCSLIGCGVQITLVFVGLLTFAVIGVFNQHDKGTTYSTIIALYSVTSLLSGFFSGQFYKSIGGKEWLSNVLLTVSLYIIPVFTVWSFLNTVAILYESTAALPFGTIMALFALYAFFALPLTLVGAIIGKKYQSDSNSNLKSRSFNSPGGGRKDHDDNNINGERSSGSCLFGVTNRVRTVPRDIPKVPWYRSSVAAIAAAGLLPFTSISVELFYVFISIWGHRFFATFGILYLVFVILLVMTACVTVTLTYVQLRQENHKWWWFSVFCGGSTAFYVYLYSFHFLFFDSSMYGFMQLSYFFGYTALLCYALFLMLGTVGFYSSLIFVSNIYKMIKVD